MSTIKSLSVGNGDMFYIKHNSDNFTIIDWHICEEDQERIVKEIKDAAMLNGDIGQRGKLLTIDNGNKEIVFAPSFFPLYFCIKPL